MNTSENDIRDTLSGRVSLEEIMGRGITEALTRIAVLEDRVRAIEVRSSPPMSMAEVKLPNGTRIRAGQWIALALGAMALAAYALHALL